MKRYLTFVVLLASMLTQLVSAAPPYVEGEVAVIADPMELLAHKVKKYLPNAGISVIEVESGKEWGLVQKLRAKGKRAGLNLIATKSTADPLYSYQWHFPAVQAEDAWVGTAGAGVIVAVLDTGLKTAGPDGIDCVEPGYDVVNTDDDPQDGDGHGTHVSGTIAQYTNNSTGAAGLAYDACIMPIKVLDDNGSGDFADIAEGIYIAVNNGAGVINMSLGTNARLGVTSHSIMDVALDYAYSNGVTVVAASGNDGSRKNVSYPAIYLTTIAVGATDLRNKVTRYSNKGKGLDLVAPGGDLGRDDNGDGYGDGVLQETYGIKNDGSEGWGYFFYQGTSMASPHVAAAAAMLISNGTATTPDEIRQVLAGSALDLDDAGFDSSSGHGLLQVYDALVYDSAGGGDPDPGTCTDADGDGWCVEDGDCDDSNGAINPGANDTRGRKGRDGVDNDCNGIVDG